MSLSDAATAAVTYFTPVMTTSQIDEMVAIAGVESEYVNAIAGDYGLTDRPQASDGSTSWGLWQINSIHTDILTSLTGASNPNVWQQWLYDPNNNAQAALAVFNQAVQYYGNGFQPWSADMGLYQQYLGQAQAAVAAALQQASPSPSTPSTVNLPSIWALSIGGGLLALGLAYLGYSWYKGVEDQLNFGQTAFAHFKPEHRKRDHRVNPKWLTYTKPTDATVAEISEPMDACVALSRVKEALMKRGVRIVEGRNLEPGIEAYFTPAHGGHPDSIFISSAITESAAKCNPYPVQVEFHEGDHALLHPPVCLPHIRGAIYSSEGHQIEEDEAQLASFAQMVELGLPVEDYHGNITPPGKLQIDWGLLKMYLEPQTYENVKWATDVVVKAAQGDDGPMTTENCPALSRGV